MPAADTQTSPGAIAAGVTVGGNAQQAIGTVTSVARDAHQFPFLATRAPGINPHVFIVDDPPALKNDETTPQDNQEYGHNPATAVVDKPAHKRACSRW